MRNILLIFILSLTLFVSAEVFSENIRGDVVENIIITDNSAAADQSFKMNIEDVFAVSFEKESEFVSGIEIEVKIPASLRNYSSSFAFIIYTEISPEIKSGVGTYYGTKYNSLIIPDAARFFVRIPYSSPLEGETGPYTTVISDILDYRDSPIMITVLPMMKGFPSSLYNNSFTISVSPILKDSGILDLSIAIPDGLNRDELILHIDGNRLNSAENLRLASGSHSLNLTIPGGRSINRNFTIDRGEISKIQLDIEKLESWASIDVPENTLVYIDGEKIELNPEKRLLMAPGEHTVLFMIGDYKISKKFAVLSGKDIKISLFLDIFVEDN